MSLASGSDQRAAEPQRLVALLSFDLGAQEYALAARTGAGSDRAAGSCVRTAASGQRGARRGDMARSLAAAGVAARAAWACREPRSHERAKVLVLSIGHGAIGLVADRSRDILRVDPGLIDPAPALLTRGAGDAEISSICRLDGGERLVAVLTPDRLFRSELVQRLFAEQSQASERRAERRRQHERPEFRHFPPRRAGIRVADRGGGRE